MIKITFIPKVNRKGDHDPAYIEIIAPHDIRERAYWLLKNVMNGSKNLHGYDLQLFLVKGVGNTEIHVTPTAGNNLDTAFVFSLLAAYLAQAPDDRALISAKSAETYRADIKSMIQWRYIEEDDTQPVTDDEVPAMAEIVTALVYYLPALGYKYLRDYYLKNIYGRNIDNVESVLIDAKERFNRLEWMDLSKLGISHEQWKKRYVSAHEHLQIIDREVFVLKQRREDVAEFDDEAEKLVDEFFAKSQHLNPLEISALYETTRANLEVIFNDLNTFLGNLSVNRLNRAYTNLVDVTPGQ